MNPCDVAAAQAVAPYDRDGNLWDRGDVQRTARAAIDAAENLERLCAWVELHHLRDAPPFVSEARAAVDAWYGDMTVGAAGEPAEQETRHLCTGRGEHRCSKLSRKSLMGDQREAE